MQTRSQLFVPLLSIVLLLSGCAANTNSALVTASAPHATIVELPAGDIDKEHVRVELVRVDGHRVIPGERRTYLLAPGAHTLSFQLDLESLAAYQSRHADNFPRPSATASSVDERLLDVVLVEGRSYRVGGRLDNYNYSSWQPYIEAQ